MYTRAEIDAWLGPLTDPAVANAERPMRRVMSQIWTIQRQGRAWAIATDGYALVLVAGEYGYDAAPEKEIKQFLEFLDLKSPGEPIRITPDELREWTGPPPDCKLVTRDHCGSTVGVEVPECEWHKDYGIICELLLDRRRLAHTLRGCLDQELTIFAGTDQIRICSANMQAVLMGINREAREFKAPEFPIPEFKPSSETDNATASGRR